MLVTLNLSQNEGGRGALNHIRHGPVNRQESWEMHSAFRIAHSISQLKAQHIQ